jgi:hypothetical protein
MIVDADTRQVAGRVNPNSGAPTTESCNQDDIILRAAGVKLDYPRVATGLVARYALEPQSLTAEQKSRVEAWVDELPHLRSDIEKMRKYAPYLNSSPGFSD